MKHIQLKYLGTGRRTVDIRTSGFMGPSRSPMGKGPLKVAGDYLKPGTLTSAFSLVIPPNGECQVVDCQHNRELLRKVTKSRTFKEDVKVFDDETGRYKTERQDVTSPPGFKVMDATPIEEDVKVEIGIDDTPEVRALKQEIAKLEGKLVNQDGPPAPDATPSGETSVEVADVEPLTEKELTEQRFKTKLSDPVSLV